MLPLIYHPIYSQLDLPNGHRYPIMKYRYLYQAVMEKLASEDWGRPIEFFQPSPLSTDDIKRVHDGEYVDLLVTGTMPAVKMRRIGFPWSEVVDNADTDIHRRNGTDRRKGIRAWCRDSPKRWLSSCAQKLWQWFLSIQRFGNCREAHA